MSSGRVRFVVGSAVVAAVAAFTLVTRMEPRIPLVVVATSVVVYGWWVWLDVRGASVGADRLTAARNRVHAADETTRRGHRRVSMLRSQLAYGRADGASVDRLRQVLVAVIDDELAATYSIDRRADPVAAGTLLAPELAELVDSPTAAARHLSDPRAVERVVSLIEEI